MKQQYIENLIIGAGLVGSLTARILAKHGHSGILVDRSPDPGGVNGSFTDKQGNWFDHGRHIINSDRSEFTRQFVLEVLKGQVRTFDLKRSVVVRGHIIPYATEIEDWPEPLRQQIRLDPTVRIKLGSTREEFSRAYGKWFANLAFDEMLPAYPTLKWQLEHGFPEESLMRWIFPWFFPRSVIEQAPAEGTETGVYSEESRLYHYLCRHANPPCEEVIYPTDRGFGRLIEEMLNDSQDQFRVYMNTTDINVDIDPKSLVVNNVHAGGKDYKAKRVYWCAPLPVLCNYLGWRLPKGEPQWEILGSFTFQDPVSMHDHEILFADPHFPIRRINNPGKISGQNNSRTLQVEYTTMGGDAGKSADEWKMRWLENLQTLGLVEQENRIVDFDFRTLSRGIVSTEDLDDFLRSCKNKISNADTNLITPHLAVASDNNSRLIPEVVHCIQDTLRHI